MIHFLKPFHVSYEVKYIPLTRVLKVFMVQPLPTFLATSLTIPHHLYFQQCLRILMCCSCSPIIPSSETPFSDPWVPMALLESFSIIVLLTLYCNFVFPYLYLLLDGKFSKDGPLTLYFHAVGIQQELFTWANFLLPYSHQVPLHECLQVSTSVDISFYSYCFNDS